MFGKKKKEAEPVRDLGFNQEFNHDMANETEKTSKNSINTSSKKSGKKSKSKSKKTLIPRTVQETIPYTAVYKNGIIEIEPGIFSRSYRIGDVNFTIATDETQTDIFERYMDFLNTFDHDIKVQLVIYNRNLDERQINNKIMLAYKQDNLNEYRDEYNDMLKAKMAEGRNNITKEKYITLTLKANDIEDAFLKFSKLDMEMNTAMKRITNVESNPLTAVERLEILADIYNDTNQSSEFYDRANIQGKNVESFDYSWMLKQGLTTKDLIGPDSFKFERNYIQIGNKYARSMFLDNLPTFLSTNILSDISELTANMLVSINYNKLRQDKAVTLLKNQMLNINSNVIDAQKRASESGYDASLISPELQKAQQEAEDLLTDVTSRNQSLLLMTFVVTVFSETLDGLNKNCEQLKVILGKYLCQLKTLAYQQEKGFSTSLPLGRCDVFTDRLLTTEAAALFIPFTSQELTQKNGMYYGLNAVSKNLILFNRKNSKNANGLILGTPGSGKSFSAKREMVNVILNTDDDIYIIDPEREYIPLAKLLGGEVITIAAGGKKYLNPMDMDTNYGNDEDSNVDPIAMKCDFIGGLCETMSGDISGLTATQKSIIDRCVRNIYKIYIDHMHEIQKEHPEITCDTKASPTLRDFYEVLQRQPEYDAQALALTLERFCVGSLDTFAHHSNVARNSRLIVYDIKDIGEGMKELGLQVCLNAIWNQIIENSKIKRYTWFYIDEFYLLTQTESSAKFLQQVYKRARKWHGIPTGITQNVGDLLASPQAVTILNNCDFILMLNQSPIDKMHLAQILNISPTELSYITNSDPGQGLIYTGKAIIPFIDRFPTNTKLYKVMSTKASEI